MFQLLVGTSALRFSSTACSTRATHSRREVKTMKEALAIIAAVLVLAYVIIQALLAVLQPLLVALAGKLH